MRKETVELETIVERAVESSRPFIEERQHQLAISLPPKPIFVSADPMRLEQILCNLLNNAAKYTEDVGKIWLDAAREGEEAVIRVRDNGAGMPPEILPCVFDLFVQADRSLARSEGGLGIGLTLVKSLVELQGDTLTSWDVARGKRTGTYRVSDRQPRPRLLRFLWNAWPDRLKEQKHINSVFFTPDGKLLALGFDDRDDTTVKMWGVTPTPIGTK